MLTFGRDKYYSGCMIFDHFQFHNNREKNCLRSLLKFKPRISKSTFFNTSTDLNHREFVRPIFYTNVAKSLEVVIWKIFKIGS